MRTFSSLYGILAALLFFQGFPLARTLRVPSDEVTIQAGLDAAIVGDTVLVAPGTYKGPGNRELDYRGKDMTLRSEIGEEGTIIDAEGSWQGVFFQSQETSAARMEGFTIRRGLTAQGGAVVCVDESNPTFTHCVFREGLASDGGAIFCYNASPIFMNCRLTENEASYWGGAVDAWSGSAPIYINCIFDHNHAQWGGAAHEQYASSYFLNCTFADNGASVAGGGIACMSSSPTISNGIFWGNNLETLWMDPSFPSSPIITYSDVQGGWMGDGNIDVNPLFRSLGSFVYLLGKNSPGIDAGDPTVFDGISDSHPRWPVWYPNRPQSDMGAYGGPHNVGWIR